MAANSLLSPSELLQRSLLFYCPQHFLRPDACLHLGNQWKLEIKVTLWYVSLKILALTNALIWSQVWRTSKFCDPISAFVAHNTCPCLCKMHVSNSHAKLNILYIAYYSWWKSFTFFAQPWKFFGEFYTWMKAHKSWWPRICFGNEGEDVKQQLFTMNK